MVKPGSSLTTHGWHARPAQQVLQGLASSTTGLTAQQAKNRLAQHGPNRLTAQKQVTPVDIYIRQFQNLLIWLLLGGVLISTLIGHFGDAAAILIIVLINSIIGFVQEFKAEQALQELQKYESPEATVIREDQEQTIPAEELVPGDILVLRTGDLIPADARLLEAHSLEVDEASLTGESAPVAKQTRALDEKTHITDASNSVFSGTAVARGTAKAVIFATGDDTELGGIAHLVQTSRNAPTPLQTSLKKLSLWLAIISLGATLPALLVGYQTGRDPLELLMVAVSLAVSAIPEGLPIVVTVTLALGIRRMLKKKALVRKLPAVEALGSTDVICTDKTGTLTQGKMTATQAWTAKDQLISARSLSESVHHQQLLLKAAVLCNSATPHRGDPTEQALLELTSKSASWRNAFPQTDLVPFDSEQKYMITLHDKDAYVKGAPEVILKASSAIQTGSTSRSMTAKDREEITATIDTLTKKGLRVLAFGYKQTTPTKFESMSQFVFLGLVGLMDPPRPQVKAALKSVRTAGVRVIMITGDHPQTAKTIASDIGLLAEHVVTGAEIEQMNRVELEKAVKEVDVFARVSAQQKLSILRALNNQGHKVAMTGDGVNDAPALKEAHIGIAVGSGTALAKEVADIVLLDDNFATIADAIYEGRGIFSNLKKFVTFLLAANFDEILTVLASLVFGTPLPLRPIHLLWLNVVTDSLPAMALAVDPYPKGLMKLPPFNPQKALLAGIVRFSLVAGILGFLSTFGIFLLVWDGRPSLIPLAQTVTFTTTVLFELWLVFAIRSETSMFEPGLFSNRYLNGALIVSILLQLAAVYTPWTHGFFDTIAIPLPYWALIVPFSLTGLFVIEALRYLKQRHFAGRSLVEIVTEAIPDQEL